MISHNGDFPIKNGDLPIRMVIFQFVMLNIEGTLHDHWIFMQDRKSDGRLTMQRRGGIRVHGHASGWGLGVLTPRLVLKQFGRRSILPWTSALVATSGSICSLCITGIVHGGWWRMNFRHSFYAQCSEQQHDFASRDDGIPGIPCLLRDVLNQRWGMSLHSWKIEWFKQACA